MLVIRRGGLGDTLLMLPVLHALRRHCAGEVHFAGVLEFAEVLARRGAVDRACSSEDLMLWSGASRARQRLADYRQIIAEAGALGPGAGRIEFDPRPARQDRPFGEQLLDRLGLPGPARTTFDGPRPRQPSAEVVLAPGSGGSQKCWPQAGWLALAAQLCRDGAPVAVLVGPAERERDDPRRWPWPAGTVFVADLEPAELATRLEGVAAFVGNDSGTTHLAAALAVPTVAVFGPTEPRVWAPPGDHVRVVGERTVGPPAVAPGAVRAALRALGS